MSRRSVLGARCLAFVARCAVLGPPCPTFSAQRSAPGARRTIRACADTRFRSGAAQSRPPGRGACRAPRAPPVPRGAMRARAPR
ncbi:hypothetical protein FFM54_01940 [Burkholderia pseudomallei]|nr:hypothetical protein FFM54_01940 [Burkholderia pseudomallei]